LDFAHHPSFHAIFSKFLWPDVPRYEVTHHICLAVVNAVEIIWRDLWG
jgi:hypothetical protein